MNALDAVTAHTVVNELGPLVARDRLSHGTRFPLPTHSARGASERLWRWLKTGLLRRRAGHSPPPVASRLSAHVMRDIGINPLVVEGSIPMPVDDMLIRDALHADWHGFRV